MLRGAMKCCNTFRNTTGEGTFLVKTDTNVLKHGDQTGLETPVVHALNDANSLLEEWCVFIHRKKFSGIAKALNLPLGEYGRKTEI